MENIKNKYVEQIESAIKDFKETKGDGVYYWDLNDLNDLDNVNNYAFVLGWNEYDDEENKDGCSDGSYRLCIKLAFQPKNSMLQCDYDFDWNLPYDKETNDVYDYEIALFDDTNIQSVVDLLLEWHDELKNEMF